MTNHHASDCTTSNGPAYVPGPCDCTPTPEMCRAAVEYMNGPDVYGKLPAEALAIEEGIYAEVWKAMRAAAPSSIEGAVTPAQARQRVLEEAAQECDHLQSATLASQNSESASLENVMLRQVATLGHAECARAIRRLASPMPPSVEKERDALRSAQAAAVMPLIGPLMDAWEQADREVMEDEPELAKYLAAIEHAMETAEPST